MWASVYESPPIPTIPISVVKPSIASPRGWYFEGMFGEDMELSHCQVRWPHIIFVLFLLLIITYCYLCVFTVIISITTIIIIAITITMMIATYYHD